MATYLWSVGWRANLADLSSTTYLNDGSVNDTTTGVGDSENFSGLDCYDPADAAVTGVIDFGSIISTYARTWSCVVKTTESNNAIACVAPPDTDTPENILTVTVEASTDYNAWVTLHTETVIVSTSPQTETFTGNYGLATTARYIRVSAKNEYGKRFTTQSIGVDITDLRSDDLPSATLAGASAVAAVGAVTATGIAALVGTGIIAVSGSIVLSASADISGTATVVAVGTVDTECPCEWIPDECITLQTFEENGGYGTPLALAVDESLYLGGSFPMFLPLSVPVSVSVSRSGYFVENWATLPYTYTTVNFSGTVEAGYIAALGIDDPVSLGGMTPIYVPIYAFDPNSFGATCVRTRSPYSRRRCF